jgi:hypothetical protein
MKTVAGALLAVGLSIGAVDALAETPAQPKAGEQGPPKTVGAMQNAVGDKATSAEDVKRQTEGKPTMAREAREGDKTTHPNITEHAPGTVGAAPGTTPPSGREAKK